jgi:hypothetical protein
MAASHVIGAAGAGVFTPAGFAEALERFRDSLPQAVVRALKGVSSVPRGLAVKKFTSRGVGKGIFGRGKDKGAYKLIKTGAILSRGGTFVLSLGLRGFAAMQEQGGRTKPHVIEPKFKKALRLKGGSVSNTFLRRGGASKGVASSLGVFRQSVKHPGSNIPRHPFAGDAMREAAPQIQVAIDREICKFTQGGVRIAATTRVA